MVKQEKDLVFKSLDFVSDTVPRFARSVYDSIRGGLGSEVHAARAEIVGKELTYDDRYTILQKNFDAQMSKLLPDYHGYENNTVSFRVKFDGINASEAADISAALEKLTGFENIGKENGSTKFIMRINHYHDFFPGVATDLAKALTKVRANAGEITLELEDIKTIEAVERTFMNITTPNDFQALADRQKDGATVAPRVAGELEV